MRSASLPLRLSFPSLRLMGSIGIPAGTARFLLGRMAAAGLICLALGAAPPAARPRFGPSDCIRLDIESPRDLVRHCTAEVRARRLDRERLVEAYTQGGNARYARNDYRGAAATYDLALRMNPRSSNARYGRGNAYYMQRQFGRALADYDEAVRREPQGVNFLIGRANARYMLRDYGGALADYEEAIRRHGLAEGRIGRANIYMVRHDYTRALADYDQGIRIYPGDANAHNGRGEARAGQRDWQGALIDFNRSIALNPRVAGVYARRARVAARLGHPDWAETDFREAERLAQAQGDAAGLNSLCWNLALAGADLDRARAHCDASLRIEPDNINTLASRALIAVKQGRFRDAWDDLNRALRRDRDNAELLYGRGLAARRLGRAAEGQRDIDRAIAIEPGIASVYADYGIAPDG